MEELPMYGGQREPFFDKKPEPSTKASDMGWRYLNDEKDSRNAMKMFNQAWYLNSDNPQAYWGFGTIFAAESASTGDAETLEKAIKMIEEAKKLDPENPLILNSLGEVYKSKALLQKDKREKEQLLKNAELIFISSIRIKPLGMTYYNWSVCLYNMEKYDEAWNKLLKANEYNYKVPASYLNDLKNKRKESPKN